MRWTPRECAREIPNDGEFSHLPNLQRGNDGDEGAIVPNRSYSTP